MIQTKTKRIVLMVCVCVFGFVNADQCEAQRWKKMKSATSAKYKKLKSTLLRKTPRDVQVANATKAATKTPVGHQAVNVKNKKIASQSQAYAAKREKSLMGKQFESLRIPTRAGGSKMVTPEQARNLANAVQSDRARSAARTANQERGRQEVAAQRAHAATQRYRNPSPNPPRQYPATGLTTRDQSRGRVGVLPGRSQYDKLPTEMKDFRNRNNSGTTTRGGGNQYDEIPRELRQGFNAKKMSPSSLNKNMSQWSLGGSRRASDVQVDPKLMQIQ